MNEYTKYRLETAAERVTVAKEMLDGGHFKDSINRSYYAIFTAARALLSEDGVTFRKHSAVIEGGGTISTCGRVCSGCEKLFGGRKCLQR